MSILARYLVLFVVIFIVSYGLINNVNNTSYKEDMGQFRTLNQSKPLNK